MEEPRAPLTASGPGRLVLTLTVGLPGSGKSTWARRRQAEDPTLVLVCRDELRAMLHDDRYSRTNEQQVVAVRNAVVADALRRGRSVIVHDTNLVAAVRADLARLAAEHGAEVVVEDFTDVPLEVCIARDATRADPVGEDVIRRMWLDHVAGGGTEPDPWPDAGASRPEAVLVDVDGAMAGPDGPTAGTGPAPPAPLARLLALEAGTGTAVVVVSGRGEESRAATERWLAGRGVACDGLHLRPAGDTRPEADVKRALYETAIAPRYRVVYAVADRDAGRALWGERLGLAVLVVDRP